METKIKELEKDFAAFIRYGQLILHCTKNEIKEHFSENQITFHDFGTDKLMEIRLSYGILTCQFDDDDICYMGFLFFCDSECFNIYKEMCNERCEVIIPNVWKCDNHYIELKSHNSDFYFTFY